MKPNQSQYYVVVKDNDETCDMWSKHHRCAAMSACYKLCSNGGYKSKVRGEHHIGDNTLLKAMSIMYWEMFCVTTDCENIVSSAAACKQSHKVRAKLQDRHVTSSLWKQEESCRRTDSAVATERHSKPVSLITVHRMGRRT